MSFLGMVKIQRSLSATYPARLSTVFETTDVNQCPSGDRHENFFQISVQGVLWAPKTQFFWEACGYLYPAYSLKATVLGDRRHFRGWPISQGCAYC